MLLKEEHKIMHFQWLYTADIQTMLDNINYPGCLYLYMTLWMFPEKGLTNTKMHMKNISCYPQNYWIFFPSKITTENDP